MEYWCIDRIEEGQAVLEGPDQSLTHLSLSLLPPEVKEGDCLLQSAGGWRIDEQETRRRRQEAAQKLRNLLGKGGQDQA
ncbi:MAG: DUF3006 domain-containing protein [Oscillospiraceae bacterium]|nr:DUF3006 domain-containing protein [Oscillospiraceae bacterium]